MTRACQDSHLPQDGDIAAGSVGYLKGAARVQTVMAVVVIFDQLGHEARFTTC